MGKEHAYLESLRRRSLNEGGIFRLEDGALAIFDPALVSAINRANYADLEMPPTLAETLPFASKRTILWGDIRKILIARARQLASAEAAPTLHRRLLAATQEIAGAPTDLTRAVARILFRATAPLIVAEATDEAPVFEDEQASRLDEMLCTPPPGGAINICAKAWRSARVGAAVKRALRARVAGPAPGGDFLSDLARMEGAWGRERATYVATTMLTAIAAAPGFVGACLLFELARHRDRADAIGAELGALSPEEIAQQPERAPLARAFLAETLRLWSFPLIVRRQARHTIEVADTRLRPGDIYVLSSYVMHRDPVRFSDPDRFDPERWNEDAAQTPPAAFGWAPRACVGAAIGWLQLMLFCRVVTSEFELAPIAFEDAKIAIAGFAAPRGFVGALRPRGSRSN